MRSPRPMNCTRTLARRGANMQIPAIRRDGARIRRAGMDRGRRIGCPSPAWSGVQVARSAYRCASTVIAPPCSPSLKRTRVRTPPSTPTSGRHTTGCRQVGGPMRRSATRPGAANGHAMMMGMGCVRSITIRWKGSGPACGTSCAPSVASASGSCASM